MCQRISFLFIFLFFLSNLSRAQTNSLKDFYGNSTANINVCPESAQFASEQDINALISEMLSTFGAKNRYIVVSCPQVPNCQATLFKGSDGISRPYILFNPGFLQKVKRLNFSSSDLTNVNVQDWTTLTILAHELDITSITIS